VPITIVSEVEICIIMPSATPPPCWSAVVVVGIDVVGAYVAAGSSVVDVAVGGVLVVGRGLLVGDGLEPPSWPYSTFAIVAESDDDRTRRRSMVAELYNTIFC
jgi:hypothetical protein